MNFSQIAGGIAKFTTKHGPEILTGLSVVGTINTAVLASAASIKATRVVDEHEINTEYKEDPKERWKERAKITWKFYIPTLISGTCTIGLVIFSNRLSVKRQAAVASALVTTQAYLSKYRDAVEEVIDEETRDVVGKAFSAKVEEENPTPDNYKDIFVHNAGGEELFLETISGRYFRSDMTSVREAVVSANEQRINDFYVTLNDFYDMLNLPHTAQGDYMGWNVDAKIEVRYRAIMSADGKPVCALEYRTYPKSDALRLD